MILLIDNYDSFVHNLARYIRRLGHASTVVRNDRITTKMIRDQRFESIILSPGPCTPSEAGNSLQIVRDLATEIPMLGVCLGHQTIAAAFGAEVIRANKPMHGCTSQMTHNRSGIFDGLPNPMTVARYHSLVVSETSLPRDLRATAWADDGTLMALEHVRLPILGWQFHPESILTEHGYPLLAAFLHRAGLTSAPTPVVNEQRRPSPHAIRWPKRPVTF